MPPLSADWSGLKAMYVKGVPAKQIAEQTGVPFDALRQRIHRERWDDDVTKAEQAVSHAVTLDLVEHGKRWVNRVARVLDSHISFVEQTDPRALKLKDFEWLVRALETLDRIGRRNYGLDQQRPQPLVQVGIVLHDTSHCDGWAHSAGAVMDVASVPVEDSQGDMPAGAAS